MKISLLEALNMVATNQVPVVELAEYWVSHQPIQARPMTPPSTESMEGMAAAAKTSRGFMLEDSLDGILMARAYGGRASRPIWEKYSLLAECSLVKVMRTPPHVFLCICAKYSCTREAMRLPQVSAYALLPQ